MTHVAIVGGGQAAASLYMKLRNHGFEGRISVFCEEPHLPYNRPPLTKKFLSGAVNEADLEFHYETTLLERKIEVHRSTVVRSIDPVSRTLLANEKTVSYDHLVFATGARARHLPEQIGGNLSGVHTIRTVQDSIELRNQLVAEKRLLVIGGGYVGLEAAATARKAGLTVHVVELEARILQRVASMELSDVVRDAHRAQGVEILEGVGLDRLIGEDSQVTRAILTNGETIDVDLVIAGIGAIPNIETAAEAGIRIENGIWTDAFGRTSFENVWATGDCASLPFGGEQIRLESVQNAIEQSEAVAANIMGEGLEYHPTPTFWSEQFEDMIQIAGLGNPNHEVVVRPGSKPNAHSFWQYKEGRLVAVEAFNEARAYAVARRLLRERISPPQDRVRDPETELKALLKP